MKAEDPKFLDDIPTLIKAVQQLHRETARLRSDAKTLLVSVVGEPDERESGYLGPQIRTTKELLDMLTECRKLLVNVEYDITAIRSFLSKTTLVADRQEAKRNARQGSRLGPA